jgi:hypothetical protein
MRMLGNAELKPLSSSDIGALGDRGLTTDMDDIPRTASRIKIAIMLVRLA